MESNEQTELTSKIEIPIDTELTTLGQVEAQSWGREIKQKEKGRGHGQKCVICRGKRGGWRWKRV